MTSTARTPSTIADAWASRADELAGWTWENLVNRSDVWGGYYRKGGRTCQMTRPAKAKRGKVELTESDLIRHYATKATNEVAGLHTTTLDDRSRWVAFDIDHHDKGVAPDRNERAAFHWFEILRELGFAPLLTRSNGRGGYHLRAIFSEPVSSVDAYEFIRWVGRDWQSRGFESAPEMFPKQPRASDCKDKCGSWMRLPGRHHTREYWSEVYDGERWLDGDGAIEHILSIRGTDPALVPWSQVKAFHQGPVGNPTDLENRLAQYDERFLVEANNGSDPRSRAVAYLKELPEAISGQRGHDATMWAARVATYGFDLGPKAGFEVLRDHYNPRCVPPWEEADLRRKCNEADTVEFNKPRGWLLAENTNGSPNNGRHQANGKPEECFANFHLVKVKKEDGEEETRRQGSSLPSLIERLQRMTGNGVRRVGKLPFVVEDGEGVPTPFYLEKTADLFAWIGRRLSSDGGQKNLVRWARGEDKPTREELLSALSQSSDLPTFGSIEGFPHHPPIASAFYLRSNSKGGNGNRLRELLGMFAPATGIDFDLIHAFFLSLFWGGPPGARPAWLFTASPEDTKGGRGVGKTTLAKVGARLVGGHTDLAGNERIPDVITRLLTPDALTRRVVFLDNLKSLKFSWAELEALITSDTISGHRMYHGEAQRPNYLNFVLTLNGAALSRDLAQRCVIVHLKRPKYSPTWESDLLAFTDRFRWEIIGDCCAELARCVPLPKRCSRWGLWEAQVLAHVAEPNDCQRVIGERQDDVDEDSAEADLVREEFQKQLLWLGHNPEEEAVFIPAATVGYWINEATGEKRPTNKASSYLGTLDLPELRKSKRGSTRGWIWTGKKTRGRSAVSLNAPT